MSIGLVEGVRVTESATTPGFVVIHANRFESLRDVLLGWLAANPLPMLQAEHILVQSNGMAQWLKMAMAAPKSHGGLGVAAHVTLQLPAQFVWQAYQAVLGHLNLPERSPYDRDQLVWQLYQLMGKVTDTPQWGPLWTYLRSGNGELKRWQLAGELAALFDQYLVYRADWLTQWSHGQAVPRGLECADATVQSTCHWQAYVWQQLRATLPESEQASSRADLHAQFLQQCALLEHRPAGLPQRLVVFGLSALPAQTLEALYALSAHVQIVMCVHNPCQVYWGDLIEGVEAFKQLRRMHPLRPNASHAMDLHVDGNPLLASWGRQGRDYIHMLDEFDGTHQQPLPSGLQRVDLFEDPVEVWAMQGEVRAAPPALAQVQQDILLCAPLPKVPDVVAPQDSSIVIHRAHSRLRELEILHNALLQAFEADESLQPRDVLVMMPNVDDYVPAVQAVFGAVDGNDARFIPYALSDVSVKVSTPLAKAVEFLLTLPSQPVGLSKLFEFLQVPAVQKRYGLNAELLDLLKVWCVDGGVRWGLNATHREHLQAWPEGVDCSSNTWMHGLARMLMGYLAGDVGVVAQVAPLAAAGGLRAHAVGALYQLVSHLVQLESVLQQSLTSAQWVQVLNEQVCSFFETDTESDTNFLSRLKEVFQDCHEACQYAGVLEALPATVWLNAVWQQLEEGRLSRRFMAGAVTFSTLMPMRAVPFRHVVILGLNDGEFPRAQNSLDFDLMSLPGQYRPGDRSRREDDRYLFLEAVLSARDRLTLSWVGASSRDNAPQAPSVLLGQWMDYLDRRFVSESGQSVLSEWVKCHPLQPFSRQYWRADGAFPNFQFEWRELTQEVSFPVRTVVESAASVVLNGSSLGPEELRLSSADLTAFMKAPLAPFFQTGLQCWPVVDLSTEVDTEPFMLAGLVRWKVLDELMPMALQGLDEAHWTDAIRQSGQRLQLEGRLPWGGMAELQWQQLTEVLIQRRNTFQQLLGQATPNEYPAIEHAVHGCRVMGMARTVYQQHSKAFALDWSTSKLLGSKGELRWDKAVRHWVDHVLLNLQVTVPTRVVGENSIIHFQALNAELALEILQRLVAAWRTACQQALPLSLNVGLAWTMPRDADESETAHVGRCQQKAFEAWSAEVQPDVMAEQNRLLALAWPQFEDMLTHQPQQWAQQIYGPLIAHTVAGLGEEHAI